jgi:ATP-dependent Clp protease ATP-binding subunit ClpA
MFERFTHAAREVVVQSQFEAREMGHSPIGTQHLLLALVADENGSVARALREQGVDEVSVREAILSRLGGRAATTDPLPDADDEDAAALKAIGIDIEQVRRAVEENFGPDALRLPRREEEPRRGLFGRLRGSSGGHIPFSPRSKKVLELSLREAIRLHHNFIAPEHIMLGVMREGEGMGALILAEARVDPATLRAELKKSLDEAA